MPKQIFLGSEAEESKCWVANKRLEESCITALKLQQFVSEGLRLGVPKRSHC